jgi:hypothetical protein
VFQFNFNHLAAMPKALIQINRIWACPVHMNIRIFE